MIPRAEHCISRSNISENALKVLYRLQQAGHEAYLVGGGVRDLLLGREPKDFDVATNATPEEIKRIFRNCRLIGRRFRLAHIFFGPEIIEVATFRGIAAEGEEGERRAENGMLIRDNVYGTLEEDAWRRDFTVNSLYYNIQDYSVVDYVGGMNDLKAGLLRVIGDPNQRYQEDPARMLRAVRFAAKLGFRISPESEQPIFEQADLLKSLPPARLFDEICKLFLSGHAVATFEHLRHYGLFEHLFPLTEQSLSAQEHEFPKTFIVKGLENTDLRVAEDKPVAPAFLFAVLLWEPMRAVIHQKIQAGARQFQAIQEAADEVLSEQNQHVAISRNIAQQVKEIWLLQARFDMRRGRRAYEVLAHPRFRAAYDFLLLRQAGEEKDEVAELCRWWTDFQNTDRAGQDALLAKTAAKPAAAGTARRRRRRPRRAKGGGEGTAAESKES
ncbi:MAG: polynucleotide adenylyltransferase PcnB [Pseudomonadota bacterium]